MKIYFLLRIYQRPSGRGKSVCLDFARRPSLLQDATETLLVSSTSAHPQMLLFLEDSADELAPPRGTLVDTRKLGFLKDATKTLLSWRTSAHPPILLFLEDSADELAPPRGTLVITLLLAILTNSALAQVKPETFVVQISDRSMLINAPEKRKTVFSVLVENRSLSDQIAKLTVRGKLLKYVSVKSGQAEAVEVENKTDANVVLVPVSPAFQEAELIFGKKAYEIPSKE